MLVIIFHFYKYDYKYTYLDFFKLKIPDSIFLVQESHARGSQHKLPLHLHLTPVLRQYEQHAGTRLIGHVGHLEVGKNSFGLKCFFFFF